VSRHRCPIRGRTRRGRAGRGLEGGDNGIAASGSPASVVRAGTGVLVARIGRVDESRQGVDDNEARAEAGKVGWRAQDEGEEMGQSGYGEVVNER
jgi:hypothetical protein